MNESVIKILAGYFTGPSVAHNSIKLSLSESMAEPAREFFAIRTKLGVTGYILEEEAEKAITGALYPDRESEAEEKLTELKKVVLMLLDTEPFSTFARIALSAAIFSEKELDTKEEVADLKCTQLDTKQD